MGYLQRLEICIVFFFGFDLVGQGQLKQVETFIVRRILCGKVLLTRIVKRMLLGSSYLISL